MLRCFWGKAREFVSSTFGDTENISTQFLRNSSLSNRSSPPFSCTPAGERWRERDQDNNNESIQHHKYKGIYYLPTMSGREDLQTGPLKLIQ
jgi:hypothetical protein